MGLGDLAEELWLHHRGKLLGALAGLLFALLIMWAGWLWTLFIFGCTLVGYFVGKRMDDHKENLAEVLDRILPPGAGE